MSNQTIKGSSEPFSFSSSVTVDQLDAVHSKIRCSDSGVAQELKEFFSFEIEGAKYHPLVKCGKWNGVIYLFNLMNRTLYNGLIPHLQQFCKDRGYQCTVSFKNSNSVTLDEIQSYVDSLNLSDSKGNPIVARDYQVRSVYDAIKNKRILLMSPTASGKSLIIYCVFRWLLENEQRSLIVVPNISLIGQLFSDFKDYSLRNKFDVEKNVHQIYAGKEKEDNSKLGVLSTWQSIAKLPKVYFQKFDAVVVDEAHQSTAKSITGIMEKCTNAWYRIGTTGTIDVRGQKVKTNKLVLQGLFGYIKQVITTKELMDNGAVSKLEIQVLNLKYEEDFCKSFGKQEYQTELDFITSNFNRNRFIAKVAVAQKKNTLILTQFVDKQAIPLYDMIKGMVENDRPVYLIYGDIEGDERERIRKVCETDTNAIIVSTYGCFSTGVSIKNLHVYIAASPSKSMVRVLQSIGRLLRTMVGKESALLLDISDDISYNKRHNYAKLHLLERLKIYASEQFKYKIIDIPFKC